MSETKRWAAWIDKNGGGCVRTLELEGWPLSAKPEDRHGYTGPLQRHETAFEWPAGGYPSAYKAENSSAKYKADVEQARIEREKPMEQRIKEAVLRELEVKRA